MAKTPISKPIPKPTSRSITDFFFRRPATPAPAATPAVITSASSSPSLTSSPINKKTLTKSNLVPVIENNASPIASGSGLSRSEVMKDEKVESKKEDKMEVDEEVEIDIEEQNATSLIIADSSRSTSIPLPMIAEEPGRLSTPLPSPVKEVASMVESPMILTTTTTSTQIQLQTPIDSSSPVLVPSNVVSSQDKGKGRDASSDTLAEERAVEEELVPELASQSASQITTTVRQSTPSPFPIHPTADDEEELSPFTDISPQLSPHLPTIPSSPTPITRVISPSKSISPEVSSPQQRYPLRATPRRSISPKDLLQPSPTKSITRIPPVTFSLPTSERTDLYMHSPSGSPLSSLPPSPATPSKFYSPLKRHRRPHTFSLEIEVPFVIRRPLSSTSATTTTTSASSSSAIASGSGTRSGTRSSGRLNSQPLKASPRKNRMEIDDEDEEDEEDEEVGDETQIVEDSEPSHSARKLPTQSNSYNSNSDSDDDEELMAALARAAARRKAGTAIVTSTADTTSTTIVSPKEARRSERVIPVVDKGKGKAVASSSMGGNHSIGAGAGKLGIAALMKESNDQAKKGITLVEQARALLDASDDSDLLNSDNDEDSDDSRPSTPLLTLSATRIDSLMDAAARVADDDEDVRSPEKKQARERASHMASILREDVDRAKGLVIESDPSELVRGFWKSEVVVIDELEEELFVGEGWKANLQRNIQIGRKDVTKFPTPISVFSRLSPDGSNQDQKDVAKVLLALICHPSTNAPVANRAIQLLNRQIRVFANSQPSTFFDTLFTISDFTEELKTLGAKAEVLVDSAAQDGEPMEVDQEVQVEEEEEEEDDDLLLKAELDYITRGQSIIRWMRVVKDLSDASRLEDATLVALVVLCVRLSVDTKAAATRATIEITLQSLISNSAVENLEVRARIYTSLFSVYKDSNPKIKLEALRALGNRTITGKIIRKWLATGLLRAFPEPLDITLFTDPPSLAVIKAIAESPLNGPFNIVSTMNDVDLYNNALIYTIALTDLCDELYQVSEKKRFKAIRNVDDIYTAVGNVETRIRTNVKSGNPDRNRAKNALLRLSHSLNYQRKTAEGKGAHSVVEGLGDEAASNSNGNGKKSKLGAPETGQKRLSFGVVPKKELVVVQEVEETASTVETVIEEVVENKIEVDVAIEEEKEAEVEAGVETEKVQELETKVELR